MIRYFGIAALIGLAATILCGCGGGGGSSPAQVNSFYSAYQVGTKWTYRTTYPDNEFPERLSEERIVGIKSVDGVDCLHIEIESGLDDRYHYISRKYIVASDEKGVFQYFRGDENGPKYNQPLMLYPSFPIRDFNATTSNSERQLTIEGKVISACTTISTVSGTYNNAVELELRDSANLSHVWLVPGIGVVKEDVGSLTGEIFNVRELVSFIPRVGDAIVPGMGYADVIIK